MALPRKFKLNITYIIKKIADSSSENICSTKVNP